MKYRIFISSVQSEFAKERKALAKYIREDAIRRPDSSRQSSGALEATLPRD